MSAVAARFIPVFLIIAVGILFRNRKLLHDETVAGLKKLIINFGLPAVFFVSFVTMELQPQYLLLFLGVFILCILLFLGGKLTVKLHGGSNPVSAFFFTGFEFGMVGVALFSSLFGTDNLHYILLIGLGHEFFIWFIYAPLLESRNTGEIHPGQILKSFASSPIIIVILSALVLNASGLYELGKDFLAVKGVLDACRTAGNITSPLILLTLGYQLKLTGIEWKRSLIMLAERLILVAVGGLLLYTVADQFIMDMGGMMLYALITFLLLPPPYIIPIFLGKAFRQEAVFLSNLLVLYTLATLILYLGAMLIMGGAGLL